MKENRSKSLSEIHQESYYDDFEDHGGGDNAIIGNMQLRNDKDKDSQVTHRISTIYSSNVDLRINTEPKQYQNNEELNETRQGGRDDSIDYIDDDDAESLTIRNTLHNEYVAAILSNDTQYTHETVNKKQAQPIQKVEMLQNSDLLEKSHAVKIKTAFVPYSKLKQSGDSQDSNKSVPSVGERHMESTSVQTPNSNNSTKTPNKNSTPDENLVQINVESKASNSNPSQELKYTNSFSGKKCKKPNVAKRKITKSIRSVKKKVKSKFLGQKTNDEPEIVALESSAAKVPKQSQNKATKPILTVDQNKFTETRKHEENTVEPMQNLQHPETNLAKKQNPSSTNDKLPKESPNLKDDKLVKQSGEILVTGEDKAHATNKQSTETTKDIIPIQKNDQQTFDSKQTNVQTVQSKEIEMSLLTKSTEKSKGNNESGIVTSSDTASLKIITNPQEKTSEPNNSTLLTTTDDKGHVISTKAEVLNDKSYKDDKEHSNAENKSLFQTRKTSTKAKNNKRNRWNKKNQNVEKKKIDLATIYIRDNLDTVDTAKSSNTPQQTRVTEVNIIDDKPKEKVTVEFEKDIIFVSDGETHKLIINPQMEKIELLKEIHSSNSDGRNEDQKHQTVDTVEKHNETIMEQNDKNSETNVSSNFRATAVRIDTLNLQHNLVQINEQNSKRDETKEFNTVIEQTVPKPNIVPTKPNASKTNILLQDAETKKQIPEDSKKEEIIDKDNKFTVTPTPGQENKSMETRIDKYDEHVEEREEDAYETDEDEWEDNDDEEIEEENSEGVEEKRLQEEEKENMKNKEVNSKPINSKSTQDLKRNEEKNKIEVNREELEEASSEEIEEEEEEEYTEDDEEEDDTTESSNIITKQYMKPTKQAPADTYTESDTYTDDQYVDAKDNSSSSGKVESSTDENSDFLSVQSEFSQLETFLNEMSAQPKSSHNSNRNTKDAITLNRIENVETKTDSPVIKEDEKKKAVQILTSKIAQIQMQENYTISNNRMTSSIESKPLEVKINSPADLFQQSGLDIKMESPSTSNSEKELVVLNTDRAGTSSSADISSEILDSSSRCDPRDIHKTSPQHTNQKIESQQKVKDETKMTMTENRQEILELLKQSLSNETVLEDIVNKLFSSVIGDTNVLNKEVNASNAHVNTDIAQSHTVGKQNASQQSPLQPSQSNLNRPENINKTHNSNKLPLQPTTTKQLHNVSPPPQSLAFSPPGIDGFDFEVRPECV